MKFFIDSGNIQDIKQAKEWGFLDGVTTNPTLIAKENRPFRETIQEICAIAAPKPVSVEVVATKVEGMLEEGRTAASWAKNVVVKIPMLEDGMKAVRILSQEGIKTNVTLIFSANQALLAAKAGASYVSPFVGRLDDVGENGMALIGNIVQIFKNYQFPTEVLVASIRHPMHVTEAALMGAHVGTMPLSVIKALFKHPLTDKGLEKFLEDWKKVPGASEAFRAELTPAGRS